MGSNVMIYIDRKLQRSKHLIRDLNYCTADQGLVKTPS